MTRCDNADGTHHMRVSTLHDDHDDLCTSISDPAQRQIELLPTVRTAVRSDGKLKRKSIEVMVQSCDRINLQGRKSKLYRAMQVAQSIDGEWNSSFAPIPSLLASLKTINPETNVGLQVDQQHRFLRCFVAFGSVISSQWAMQPLLGFDGTHFRGTKYNGVILSIGLCTPICWLRNSPLLQHRRHLWYLRLHFRYSTGAARTSWKAITMRCSRKEYGDPRHSTL